MSTFGLDLQDAAIPLERESFLLTLAGELAGALQDVVGTDEAAGFVSIVGQRIGDRIDAGFKSALNQKQLTKDQIGEVLVELKRRIQGNFSVVEEDDEKIVLVNTRCPFGEGVVGRPSLCMMTSNVFGVIVSNNFGYSRVVIEAAIANGDPGCRVVVYLNPSREPNLQDGREYFKG